jgi:isoleucyl-tRNA synthetase
MADAKENVSPTSYKDTLNLPRTGFPMRPTSAESDPRIIERWNQENLSHTVMSTHAGNDRFILHDGPPYANGNIHIGHAYNKILKDIVTKSQRMIGKHVPITPGWDCHGLPIEIKVTKEHPNLSRADLKKKCRDYAQQWIDIQREQFKKLGIFMDWQHYYATMEHGYEADTIRAFAKFVEGGYIERKNKTVPWCFSDQTVLASAEIEYQERKDPSIYVKFPLLPETVEQLFPALAGKEVSLLVWTTTPWTLPLNRAVLIKPDTEYAVVDCNGTYVMVGSSRVAALAALVQADHAVVATVNAAQLAGELVEHPFIDGLQIPLIADQSVSLDDGTAAVHCAPGAGPEDYEVGIKNNLLIYSPVGPDGRYTEDVMPSELAGMSVTDGQIWVLKKLTEKGRMFYKTSIRHSYPHCWRCHNGLIFRATKQWFCNLAKNNLKEATLEAIQGIKNVPENSKNRLLATVDGRLEWCLSRQRVWGTPITALLCKSCDGTIITQKLFAYAADHIAKEGIEWWETVSLEELKTIEPACDCGSTDLIKEEDILDVWFDSGISHQAVLRKQHQFPADMYLEGKDQHRGWFQSSLLSSMVIEQKPPMKTIMTHGFTVDAQGKKMSKSLGNTISPDEMVARLSTDGLRLWAAMIDCSGEAVVSDVLLNNVQQVYRKIRNTARFLLSVLYDYDHTKDAVSYDQMRLIDRYALQELAAVRDSVVKAYADYNFTSVAHKLSDHCAVNLSALYLDVIKDRLYCDKDKSVDRRSAQTVCYRILDTLNTLCAPILSITSELIFDEYKKGSKQSIHERTFTRVESAVAASDTTWTMILEFRSALLKAIEGMRETGLIKHSLEAALICHVQPDSALGSLLEQLEGLFNGQSIEDFFKELLIVSKVTFVKNSDGLLSTTLPSLFVSVVQAPGAKCPRCWLWTQDGNADDLCNRCKAIV